MQPLDYVSIIFSKVTSVFDDLPFLGWDKDSFFYSTIINGWYFQIIWLITVNM